ncbi:MAG TPA: DUF2191 domain-containing protein [Thermoanaerobaculia bacterium]|nr:DUF2191 domain-containing protein [Thermoanaerobaculia bacterium]
MPGSAMPKRTTLTLDDDVAAKLDRESRRSGESFRVTVNRVIRRGLHPPAGDATRKPFRVRARRLGLRPGVDLDDIGALLDRLDGPSRR